MKIQNMSVNRFHSIKYNTNQQRNLRNHSYWNITILFSLNLLKKTERKLFFIHFIFFSCKKTDINFFSNNYCCRVVLKTSLKARVNKMLKILKKGGTYNNINVKFTICYVKHWIIHSNYNSCNCKHFFIFLTIII